MPAFQEIYDEHFRFVWRVLRRMGVAEQDANDAVQDVFLVVHRKLPEFRGESKLTTWLFGICLRVASDRRRAAHTRRELFVSDPPEGRADEDVSQEVERREGLALLEGILDEMPLEQRAVFTLFELDGMKCEEIAELVAAPIGTVYSRLRLARGVFQRAVSRQTARERFQLGMVGGQVS